MQSDNPSRRQFLAGGAALIAGSLVPDAAFALDTGPRIYKPGDAAPGTAPAAATNGIALESLSNSFWQRPRELWLYRRETGENIRACYWRDGQINADGYWKLCALLRDVRQNIMTTMDPALLDILRGVSGYYEQWNWPYPIVVNSGFRTLKTNNALENAARNSMHLYGRAADLYIPGIPLTDLTRLGLYFQRGGVGFYPDSGFVHLDTGRVRSWQQTRKR